MYCNGNLLMFKYLLSDGFLPVFFIFIQTFFFVYLIQSEVIYLTVNRLKRIRVRCGQWIRN